MSEQEIKQIREIIKQSFLREDEKDVLQRTLDVEGASIDFFRVANELFGGALRRRGEVFEDVARKFDEEETAVGEEYRTKVEVLNNNLERSLAGVEITDLKGKQDVFYKYYAEKDRLNGEYLDRLKVVTSRLAMKIINDV